MIIIETADAPKQGIIRPSEVRLTREGYTQCAFGKSEVESTAGRLVQFFRQKDYWGRFRLTELFEFYRQNDWNPDLMLFGLIGPWQDELGRSKQPSARFIGCDIEGNLCVTKDFVDACRWSEAQAA